VHTGQDTTTPQTSTTYSYKQFEASGPTHYLDAKGPSAGQLGTILAKTEKLVSSVQAGSLPRAGDTNSALSAIVAKRLGVPVYHMEAGNRCYDDRVPEEVNRRVIDHSSDVLMPYTERSRKNCCRGPSAGERIFVTAIHQGSPSTIIPRRSRRAGILKELGLPP